MSGLSVKSSGHRAAENQHDHRGLRVLWVGGEAMADLGLERLLSQFHAAFECTADLVSVASHLGEGPDLFLIDLDGLGALSPATWLEWHREVPRARALVLTSRPDVAEAVAWIQAGAADYLARPLDDEARLRAHLGAGSSPTPTATSGDSLLVGQSEALRDVLRRIESLQHNESNVLIQGESGTGKELLARAVHDYSPRSEGPFVPVDCGALPETIIESELFGHRKGAFTGAMGSPGLFRMAEGGTIFLDEIGEIPPAVQAKLLRALQHKEVRPVGAARALPVDIRVIAATHRDLAGMVEAGSFRMDLYYRLNVVRLEIPPLRDRPDDIEPLAKHFLEKHGGAERGVRAFSPESLSALREYTWPGNIRELENVVESSLPLVSGPVLGRRDLTLATSSAEPQGSVSLQGDGGHSWPLRLEAYEKAALERALDEASGDASAAAELLGIGRSTFYRKLARHGLTRNR